MEYLTQENDYYKQVVDLYIAIYSEPPYNEDLEYENIYKYLKPFLKQVFMIYVQDGIVLGFLMACKDYKTTMANQLSNKNISCKKDMYLAELGVDVNHRGKGIASMMMQRFLETCQQPIYLRTAKYDNDKVISYYTRLGFIVTNVEEDVYVPRKDGTVSFDTRLYMTHHPH